MMLSPRASRTSLTDLVSDSSLTGTPGQTASPSRFNLTVAGGALWVANPDRLLRFSYASAETEVLSKRESQSRPGFGIVTVRTRGLNQRDETVIEFERSIMLPL